MARAPLHVSFSLYTLFLAQRPGFSVFFFNDTATTEIYTLSLHDALPILFAQSTPEPQRDHTLNGLTVLLDKRPRSEQHTSELQSLRHLVCRLLLEEKIFPRDFPVCAIHLSVVELRLQDTPSSA